jgi:hypothetical protein
MTNLNKKGQDVFGMSFSTIFSIILIVFIVAVAFFAINHFIGLSKCTNVGLFYDDLREEVRDAWSSSSGRYESEFTAKIPQKGLFGTGITHICFGKLSYAPVNPSPGEDGYIKDQLLNKYSLDPNGDHNVFAYPPDAGCDEGLSAIVLKCINADCVTTNDQFFCQPVADDGTVTVKLYKAPEDYKITLMKV